MKPKKTEIFSTIGEAIKIGDPYCKGIESSLFQDIITQCGPREICDLSDKSKRPECKATVDDYDDYEINCFKDVSTNCRISIDSVAEAYKNAANAKDPECYSEDPMYEVTQKASLKCAQGKR